MTTARLKSLSNIRLAWTRTLTGENTDYRSLQRIEIDSFGWAEDDNLLHLRKELIENIFVPSQTTKIYIPKPSGLLRPITILRIKDAIVYQAIANLIAEKARRRLERYYFKMTFSNILASTGYQHFFWQWRIGRRKLDSARKQAFNEGYKWSGELDLTSFYDLIDHDLLRSVLKQFYDDDDDLALLFSCLSKWTIHPKGFEHSHGIPQGPLPSSFIAECVLHGLDRSMTKLAACKYFRYVDDITVMAKNERDAHRLFGQIEVLCRVLGLVPQIKRPIRKLDDIEDLMFPEPSADDATVFTPLTVSRKQNDASRKIFLSCFKRGKLLSNEEQLVTKLNYSLFRMNRDRRISKKVLGLLTAMPCVANAVNFHLRKYGTDRLICNRLLDYLDSEPTYDFVSARCLETIYFSCSRGLFSALSRISKKFVSGSYQIILRATATKILGLRKVYTKGLLQMLNDNNDTYLTEHLLFALSNSLSESQKQQTLNKSIRADDNHVALTAAFLLTFSNLKLSGNIKDVNSWATPILTNKGLTRKRVMGDRVGDIVKKRFDATLPVGSSFRNVLNRGQYRQALVHLNMAEGGFATNRSLWVTQMDNFNQIILSIVYRKLGIGVLRGSEFGSLSSNLLRAHFPNLAAVFERCHNARLANPVPHAYSRLLGTFPRDIKPGERDKLCKELKIAYGEFISKI